MVQEPEISGRRYAKGNHELNRAGRYRLRHLAGCCTAAILVHNASDDKQCVKLVQKDVHQQTDSKLFHVGKQD